jgi:hypothetical protein
MTMPASGPISLGQANTELGFSATALISMNDAAVRTLAGVGGSGTQWSMDSLYGKSARTFSLASLLEIFGDANSGGTAYAEYRFAADGGILGGTSQDGTFAVGNWTTPITVGIGSSYWIRATQTASSGPGTNYGDSRGVWLQLDTGRTFGVSKTANGLSTRQYDFEIASDSGGSNIVATATGIQYNIEIIF